MAGSSSAEIHLTAEAAINGEIIGNRCNFFSSCTCDMEHGVKRGWSRRIKKHYLYVDGWSGTAVYGGINFTEKKCVKLKLSSVYDDRIIVLNIGKNTYKADITATTAYDDFEEYIIPIEKTNEKLLTITMSGGMGLLDISVE